MKILQVTAALTIFALSLGVSFGAASYIAENYFFDKLYYQKSDEFGYVPYKNTKDIGQVENYDYDRSHILSSRMTGLSLLSSGANQQDNVLGATTEHAPYTIAVIGDSYVWGQGIKIQDRLSEVLEKKLTAVRPTKVYALGKPADDFLENLSKYYLVSEHQKIDMFVFVVVYNDILVLPTTRYPSLPQEEIMATCSKKGKFYYDYIGENWSQYAADLSKAWKSAAHQCVLEEVVDRLPQNAIYLVVDSYWTDCNPYVRLLQNKGLAVYELSRNSPGIEAYQKYWTNPEKYFQVSPLEGHPSKLANSMWADFVFHELTTNKRWGLSVTTQKQSEKK